MTNLCKFQTTLSNISVFQEELKENQSFQKLPSKIQKDMLDPNNVVFHGLDSAKQARKMYIKLINRGKAPDQTSIDNYQIRYDDVKKRYY